jgi:hypothetical protein
MNKQLLIDLFFHNGTYCAGKWRNASLVPEIETLPGKNLSEKVWRVFHKRPHCPCGKETKYLNFTSGYRPYCSSKCAQTSEILVFEKRHAHEKRWSLDEWKQQTSSKMKEAHFKNRTPKKLAKLAEKGIIPLDTLEPGQSNEYRWRHSCGEIFTRSFARIGGIYCPSCHVSKGQGELYEAVKRLYSGKIIVNDRTAIAPKEIDIYLPELKIGFEFNGKYWHPGDGSREKHKSAECDAAGIRLIHVWEIDWNKSPLKTVKQLEKLLR